MSLLPSETRASIRTEVARAVGALEVSGTVKGSPTADTFDSSNLIYANANALRGFQVVFKTGTGAVANNERLITLFYTADPRCVVAPAFGTIPASGDTFDIYNPSIADKALLDLAIKDSIEKIQDIYALYWEDSASLSLGSVLANGGFEDWSSGTTAAPDSWRLSSTDSEGAGTVARSTIVPAFSRYSVALSNTGSNYHYIQQQAGSLIYPQHLLVGHTGTFKVLVRPTSSAANRIRLNIYTGANNYSSYHTGATVWEELSASASITSSSTACHTRVLIETGTAITINIAQPRFEINGMDILEYYLPKKFSKIQKIYREESDDWEYTKEIPQRFWGVDLSRNRIVLKREKYVPTLGYRLKLTGQTYQAVPSADTDSVELPLSYIIESSRAFILHRLGKTEEAMSAEALALRSRRQLLQQGLPSTRRTL